MNRERLPLLIYIGLEFPSALVSTEYDGNCNLATSGRSAGDDYYFLLCPQISQVISSLLVPPVSQLTENIYLDKTTYSLRTLKLT